MKRVDADDFGVRVAGVIGPLFAGPEPTAEGDPFAKSKVTPSSIERVVAGMIWPRRRPRPIALKDICAALGRDERTVKAIVEQLVITHRMRIGASREDPWGYYIPVTAEELEAACAPYESQIFAMWRRLRVMRSPVELARLRGQLVLDSEGE